MLSSRSREKPRHRLTGACATLAAGAPRLLRLERLESRRLLTVVFEDTFPRPSFDPAKWASVAGASIDNVGLQEPSLPLSARFNRHPTGGDLLESRILNLAAESSATISYWFQRTGGGEPPEPDADLVLEFQDAASEWIEVFRHIGDGPAMVQYELEQVDLPAEALHGDFQFRFRLDGTSSLFDDWFVDDVRVTVGPGEIEGRKFNDIDRDGAWSPGDEPLADWTVFLDMNANGKLDEGEPFRKTDAEGRYHFAGLVPDIYTVAEVQQEHWVPTLPHTPGSALTSVATVEDGIDTDAVNGAWSVAVSSDNRFVYTAAAGDDAVSVFSRDATTGELRQIQSIRDGDGPVTGLDGARAVVHGPDGRHLYVAASNDDAVILFARDEDTGQLAWVDEYRDGADGMDGLNGAWSLAVSPDGLHVYVTGSADDAVATFSRDVETGELTFLEALANGDEQAVDGGDPIEIVGLDGARSVVISPDGAYVYIASSNDGAVVTFARDALTGSLTFVESLTNELEGVEGFDGAFSATISSNGSHVYVSSVVDNALVTLLRDPLTGRLSSMDVERDDTDGVDGLDFAGNVIVSPDGRHVYVAGADDDAVAIFARNKTTGELTFSQAVRTGQADLFGVRGIALTSDSRYLYTAASLGNAVATFHVPTVHVMRIISGQTAGEMDFASFATAPIWSGRGENALWSSEDNWLGKNPPTTADRIIFEGLANPTNLNDLPAGMVVRSIELAEGGFLVAGNGLVLDAAAGPAIWHRRGVNRLRLPLTFASSATVRIDQGALNLWNSLDTGGNEIVVQTNEGATSTITGQIIGAGDLVKRGIGTLKIFGVPGAENSYGGPTVVEAGVLQLLGAGTLGGLTAGTDVRSLATLWIATPGVVNEPVTLSGELLLSRNAEFVGRLTLGPAAVARVVDDSTPRISGAVDDLGLGHGVTYESQSASSVLLLAGRGTYGGPTTLTGAGTIRLAGNEAIPELGAVILGDETDWQLNGFDARIGSLSGGGRIEVDQATLAIGGDDTSSVFAGTLAGNGTLEKSGQGTLTLESPLGLDGPVRILAGQLITSGAGTFGEAITVYAGAVLTPAGALNRPVEVHSGGRLAPGPEVVELATGDLTLHSESTLVLKVDATGHDRIVVTGEVSLEGAVLDVQLSASPASDRLLLIDNDGTDAVVGALQGLPDGALQVINGVQFVITYNGGDGNDVELITLSTISGLIFHDRNGDAVRGEHDRELSGWTVFLDRNNNGTLDPEEPTATTNSHGRFTFRDVAAGVARVTQVMENRWEQTTPDVDPFLLRFEQLRSNSGPVDSLDGAWSVAVSPDGKHVYATSAFDSAITVLSRNETTGRLTFIESHFDNAGGIDGLAAAVSIHVSPDGRHVYAAGLVDNAIAVFARQSDTGRLTFVQSHKDNQNNVDGLADVLSVTVSPDGRHVYATGNRDNALAVFRRNTNDGSLTFIESIKDGQPRGSKTVDGLAGAWHVTVSPDGQHVYATANFENALAVFARDADSGQLTFVEAVKQGVAGINSLNGASAVAVSPDGKNVYVAADRDDTLTVFERDAVTGKLSIANVLRHGVDGVNGLNGANSIAISPDGDLVYVTGLASNTLAAFTRDPQTGLLTFVEVRGDNFQGADGLGGVRFAAVSPDGKHLYTAASSDDAVGVFARDVPYFQFPVSNGQMIDGLAFGVRRGGPDSANPGSPRTPVRDIGNDNVDVPNGVIPRLELDPDELTVVEGGGPQAYAVTLHARPAETLTIHLAVDGRQAVLSDTVLVFTAADWHVPQTVSVTALDDGLAEGDHSILIEHRVFGEDLHVRPDAAAQLTVRIVDTATIPSGLPGDTNRDGTVDIVDLNNVRNQFGASGPGIAGDANGDGVVDIVDLNAVRNHFGASSSDVVMSSSGAAMPRLRPHEANLQNPNAVFFQKPPRADLPRRHLARPSRRPARVAVDAHMKLFDSWDAALLAWIQELGAPSS